MDLIKVEKVCADAGGRNILSDLNISVSRGEKVLIKGRSGIGKTTIFRLLLGFKTPSSGTIYFEGRPMDPGLAWISAKRWHTFPRTTI
jgi:putative ABC transport system ATP-binding protein